MCGWFPILGGRVHCLPNAIPFQGVKMEEITVNTSGKVRFVFQGGYHVSRGIEWLFKIWAALPPCNASLILLVVGHRDHELAALTEMEEGIGTDQ